MKVVIYGLGKEYESDKKFIEREFDIVAYSDKKKHEIPGFVDREDIKKYQFDFIYVTSSKYFEEIKKELVNLLGIVDIFSKEDVWKKINKTSDIGEYKVYHLWGHAK